MSDNSTLWKQQLRRVAEQLKLINEFWLKMYWDNSKSDQPSIPEPPDMNGIACAYECRSWPKAEGYFCIYVPEGHFIHTRQTTKTWAAQGVRPIFTTAGTALEVAPPNVRSLFRPVSLKLSRDCRWFACLFDIALENRPGIVMRSRRRNAVNKDRQPNGGPWMATIKKAVEGSIELIDLLLSDTLTANTTFEQSQAELLANAAENGTATNGKASNENAKRRGRQRGRKLLDDENANRRIALIDKWKQAKEVGEKQKAFCEANGVTTKHLTTCIEWAATRRRRGQTVTPTKPVKRK